MRSKHFVGVKVLPGEPTDGSGRVCIHLVVPDPTGPFAEPHFLHPKVERGQVIRGELVARSTRCRLACDPRRSVRPVARGAVIDITNRTTEPSAVTCPRCIASESYKKLVREGG